MGKQVTALLMTLFAVCACRADYLLWYTVSSSDDGFEDVSNYLDELQGDGRISDSDDVYAQVVAEKNGTKTVLGKQGFTSEWAIDGQASVSLSALGNDMQAYSYYIEIKNYKTSGTIGYSKRATYTSLSGSITDSLASSIPGISAWHGSGYSSVPEPTSAMLALLGSAVLALRRKRRIA